MANNFKLTVTDDIVRSELDRVLGVLRQPQPMMLEIAEHLVAETQQVFDDEGYPAKTWAALRPSTQRNRARRGYWPGKILTMTGTLYRSIQANAGNDFAEAGTNQPYARIQHDGGTIQRSGQVRLRTDKKGNLKRQKGHPNLAIFARNAHKNAVARAVNYAINIPARPYFPITPEGGLTPSAYDAVMGVLRGTLRLS
ncbi:phage virion morphogenesis protein [Serratia fonticola]|uniref:Phage virion morphogenesis protein n=1 Tax=Serratia fonticola TaxID=47917 RepID=A0AAW3WY10_SERFO|nr:phage virion morphogenesis protein [Serratia fonticola]MBC3215656.1 phage virion morphogenesis protein [Serratia fonticola]NYA10910.1 phage virion morphogenesis protein [Serratia fonticola]NYA32888.1 phage virion morphogenesis protein [Serratia fonticola]